jgi:diguanylate cyclase (GGDEF)-like protein/PAS domain S-box-containing protein
MLRMAGVIETPSTGAASQLGEDGFARLREAEERFRLAFEHAPIGIALVLPDGAFMRVNRALCELVGYPAEELVTKTFQELTHPEDLDSDLDHVRQVLAGDLRSYEMEKRYFHRDGHIVWVLLSVSLVRDPDGAPVHFISQIQDITERKQLEERLVFLADHDEMTGLANRRRFREEVERGVAYADRYGHPAAMLLVDLDNFKDVNDSLGHHVGDRLLVGVAERLQSRLRRTDLLGRIGGDEFAALLPQAEPAQAIRVAEEVLEAVTTAAYALDGHVVTARASVGLALFRPGLGIDSEDLQIRADVAMYSAKREGGNRVSILGPDANPPPPGSVV